MVVDKTEMQTAGNSMGTVGLVTDSASLIVVLSSVYNIYFGTYRQCVVNNRPVFGV